MGLCRLTVLDAGPVSGGSWASARPSSRPLPSPSPGLSGSVWGVCHPHPHTRGLE